MQKYRTTRHTWDACTVKLLSSGVIDKEGADAGLLLMARPLPGRSSWRESAVTVGLLLIILQDMHKASRAHTAVAADSCSTPTSHGAKFTASKKVKSASKKAAVTEPTSMLPSAAIETMTCPLLQMQLMQWPQWPLAKPREHTCLLKCLHSNGYMMII